MTGYSGSGEQGIAGQDDRVVAGLDNRVFASLCVTTIATRGNKFIASDNKNNATNNKGGNSAASHRKPHNAPQIENPWIIYHSFTI